MERLIIKASVEPKKEGTFRVVASTGEVDRMGDRINPSGWYLANFKKNPVMLWAHDNYQPPVARAEKVWIEDEKLMIDGIWAPTPFAQELRVLEESGFLNTVSVGFMPLVFDEKGAIEIEGKNYRHADTKEIKSIYESDGLVFEKQELLETSWVCVPALPSALVEARKNNLELVAKSLEMAIKEKDNLDYVFEKPYPTEHSCRISDPGKYDRFARKNCEIKSDGKCIDVIYGIKEDKSEIQAYRYDKEIWTESSAKSHCTEHDGSFEAASKEESKECIEKEGRVLSTKNRNLINDCIKQMGDAIDSLKELLEATEPEKGISPAEDKGRKSPQPKKKSNGAAELYWLRVIDKACENLLIKQRQK